VAERTRSGSRGTTGRSGTTRRAGQSSTAHSSATRGKGASAKAATAAAEVVDRASAVTHPERSVVSEPPPEPDYPRFRVEPGTRARLADIDPDESEGYKR
jgi:hypothetical protein